MTNISPLTWWILALILLTGLLIGLGLYLREMSLRRAALPSAFLISLLVHLFVGSSLFFVTMRTEIAAVVEQAQTYIPVLTDYATSTRTEALEGYKTSAQPYELVGDITSKESVAATDLPQSPLETPAARVSPQPYKTTLSVPREETSGQRADETPVVPDGPRAFSPARTFVPTVETPVVPQAPIETVPVEPSTPTSEAPAPKADVEIGRAPAEVDPLSATPVRRPAVPEGPGLKTIVADVHDDRPQVGPLPVGGSKSTPAIPRSTRPIPVGENVPVIPSPGESQTNNARGAGTGPGGTGTGKNAVNVEIGRQGTDLSLPGASSLPSGRPSVGKTASGPAIGSGLGGGSAGGRGEPAPSFAGGGNVPKRRPGALGLPYAEGSIGPESLLKLRQGERKLDEIERRGGSKGSQEAVQRGLVWLKEHQFPDGRWSLHDFSHQCQDHKACTAQGDLPCDTAATGLALLPFLGDGHTQDVGRHPELVQRGLDWLIKKQKKSGELTGGDEGKARLYGHALAAIALCEAYAMTEDPRLAEPAQRSIDFIVAAQHKPSGGWRYQPNEPGDTSVVGWQIMALKSGQMARLNVPQQPFELSRKWLDSVEGLGSQRGRFGYQNRIATPSMTAEGLLCRQYLGASRDDPSLLAGANYLLVNLPDKRQANGYYWYYGTQTMYHLQGDHWQKWNAALRDMLVAAQIKEGSMSGTWDPVDRGEVTGGRLFATSLRVLMLEVYYRHLPLYQALEE